MTEPHPEIVIVRRRGLQEDEHHGGAWKIAFADFMTAMMAFFLVLWIISATDKNTKTLIARYFNPVKVEEPAKAQKGIHGAPEKDAAYSPGEETGGPTAGKPSSERGEAAGEKAERGAHKLAEPKRAGPPAHPVAVAAAGPGETLSNNVGAGAVQRSSSEPRQDRRRATAWPSRRSFGGAEGLRRSGAKRGRRVA